MKKILGLIFILLLTTASIFIAFKVYWYRSIPVSSTGKLSSAVNVDIFLDNVKINLSVPLYLKDYRILIPVEEFVHAMGGDVREDNDKIVIAYRGSTAVVDISDNEYSRDGRHFLLKEKILSYRGHRYMNFFDMENIMGFWSQWNSENKSINIYSRRNTAEQGKLIGGKRALIRLEDVGPGGPYRNSEGLTKLKVIGDYLYSKGVPFHVAWIPRYISPGENYDYDFLKTMDLYGAEFVYTLDYLEARGGLIGLHGYTHQVGKSQSGIGYEFYDVDERKDVKDRGYMKEQVVKAIETANKLKIKYYFYESAHYWANKDLKSIMERHFKYLYQPDTVKSGLGQKNISREANGAIYVPTPLGYVNGGDGANNVVEGLNTLSRDTLASFFFHPFLEFKYIKLNPDGTYIYDRNSRLHSTINAFQKKGYGFIRIDSIK